MAITSTASHGLEISRRALHAQQVGLNTTGHNIANANTPGFSRRQVSLENAVSRVNAGIGNGADAATVVRQRSHFADAQMRVQQQVLGRWDALARGMRSVEMIFNEPAGAGSSEAGTIFNEPSGVGLSGSFSRFWNAWQDLANVPESGAARAAVRQEADFLTTSMRQYHAQLRDTRLDLDNEVLEIVHDINELVDQLAAVNVEIPRARFDEGVAGDLEDQRDRLVEELSTLADISITERENGQVMVLLSGHNLVEGEHVVHLRVRQLSQDGATASQVVFEGDHTLALVREGRLRGVMEVRDEVIPGLMARLDEMAAGMVEEVNRLHRGGYGRDGSTGKNFFDPEKAAANSIVLDDAILEDINNIAASADGNSGDNGMALAISGLRNKRILAGDAATIEDFYYELLGEVGARSKEAQSMAENNRLFAQQIENRRQSVQGVSLNDEAAQLVLFQRAYQAAARTVSIIDELMEITINI